jgi:hypothetical protein
LKEKKKSKKQSSKESQKKAERRVFNDVNPYEIEYNNDTPKISTDDSNSKNCSICGLDVSWAYITHSDASISQASHTCAICKRTVCSICAPAGDVFKGDGIQSSVSLADRRIVIPSVILDPQRVCAHCYLDSYDII